MKQLTPKKIFQYLNENIIGQDDAKKAVSIAMRNRWRRQQLTNEFKQEIYPKNILMVGPTGSGKTEIARRLSKLTNSPFIKVEATKFTELGYHGKDVDQIIKDLVNIAMQNAKNLVKNLEPTLKPQIDNLINEQILNGFLGSEYPENEIKQRRRELIQQGEYDDRYITIEIPQEIDEKTQFESIDQAVEFIQSIRFYQQKQKQTLKQIMVVSEAKQYLYDCYMQKIQNEVDIKSNVIKQGIVFIDEIDKIASPQNVQQNSGKSPSTDGVQRDLLPLIEGTTISTKHGDIKTDHILFITGGAFSQSKPTDLMPELLGRLPIRVDLKMLTIEDFIRILKEPKYNLILQQQKLLEQDGIELIFTDCSIQKLAEFSFQQNQETENIGARRLHAIIEKLIEDISFESDNVEKQITIDAEFVENRFKDIFKKQDLRKYLI